MIDLCVLVATVLSTVVLLGIYYGWPMVGGDLQYDRQIFIAMPAFLMLVVAGLLWAILCLWPSMRGERTWSMWSALTPAVALSAVLVVVLFPWGRFDEARPQLETIAHEVIAEPEGVRSGVTIRGLEIARVAHHRGAVYFIEADNSFGTTHGWIYSPNGSLKPKASGTSVRSSTWEDLGTSSSAPRKLSDQRVVVRVDASLIAPHQTSGRRSNGSAQFTSSGPFLSACSHVDA